MTLKEFNAIFDKAKELYPEPADYCAHYTMKTITASDLKQQLREGVETFTLQGAFDVIPTRAVDSFPVYNVVESFSFHDGRRFLIVSEPIKQFQQ